MAAGYGLRRVHILNDNFVKVSNRLNFNITLPVLLFCDIARMPLSEIFNPAFVLFCMGVTLVSICAVWGLAAWRMEGQAPGGRFCAGLLSGQLGDPGRGADAEYLRRGGHRPDDDHRLGAAVQHLLGADPLSFGAEKSGLSRASRFGRRCWAS